MARLLALQFRRLALHSIAAAASLGVVVLFVFYIFLPWLTHHSSATRVPDLHGLDVNAAEKVLKKLKLRMVRADRTTYDVKEPPNTVLQQYPVPGTRVKKGRGIYLTLNAAEPPIVLMPKLVHGTLRNALISLKNQGLMVGEITHVPDIAQHIVLAQHHGGQPIEPGTELPKGSTIDLTVGKGLGKVLVVVPYLEGHTLAEAEQVLLAAGFQLGNVVQAPVTQVHSVPDTVCRQMPEAGTRRRMGTLVDLWVVNDTEE